MKSWITICGMILLVGVSFGLAQVTGLAGWNIILDPGHSQNENMGIYNYSEAYKNLRVALNLRQLLSDLTDIDTVYMTRTNDQQMVSLSQRTNYANSLGTAWFHSIHSDAGSPEYNSTLLLWGGWRQNGQTVEKIPHGGHAMSIPIVSLLTRGMRTNTRGDYADRTFYQGFPYNHDYQYPYLHVNRETTMPSELSEAGFHTNPMQNQLNMNAEWKRLEAWTFYWAILKYHGIQRLPVGIVNGIIRDKESLVPVNGATATLNGQSYTTDTYESLFHNYSTNPDQLHNGFYYFEGVPNQSLLLRVTAPGYYPDSAMVAVNDTFFTFQDFRLFNKIPPRIVTTYPAPGDTMHPAWDGIQIEFSRSMDSASVATAFQTTPAVSGVFSWKNNSRKMIFNSDELGYLTEYTVTVGGAAQDIYGHYFDGNGDGTGGDDYQFTFRTGQADMTAPVIQTVYPPQTSNHIELHPIISLTFDEIIDTSQFDPATFKFERFADHSSVDGQLKYYTVRNQSVLHYFPAQPLNSGDLYVTRIYPGIRDLFGNVMTTPRNYSFQTGNTDFQITMIDRFDSGVTSNWWQPQQSGSTQGLLTDSTFRLESTQIVNHLSNSTKSMELHYGWDEYATNWLIREYLGGGTPRNVTFDNSYILQVYLFGDGSGNKFRFCVDEKPDFSGHEVSPWYTIDWRGWKLVSWDLANDGCGTWIGDDTLTNPLRFDSFQLTHVPGAALTGVIWFDDLRLVKKVNVANEPEKPPLAADYQLYPNYPNPFNPTTTLAFRLPLRCQATLKVFDLNGRQVRVVAEGELPAGEHRYEFDAAGLASGVYFYVLQTGQITLRQRMVLLK